MKHLRALLDALALDSCVLQSYAQEAPPTHIVAFDDRGREVMKVSIRKAREELEAIEKRLKEDTSG